MDHAGVAFDVDESVATVRLARPDKRNALNERMVRSLEAFFVDPPPQVRAVLLLGEGNHFSAGLDLAEQETRTPYEGMEHSRLWHRAFDRIENGRLPVVSVLHGA